MVSESEKNESAELIRGWYDDYSASHGPTPIDDMSKLEARLDLSQAHPAGIAQLLTSGRVALAGLFRDNAQFKAGVRRLDRVLQERKTKKIAQGIAPLSLAVGTASWKGASMPVLLYPVEVQVENKSDCNGGQKDKTGNISVIPSGYSSAVSGNPLEKASIVFTGSAVINRALTEYMAKYNVRIDTENIIESIRADGGTADTATIFSHIISLVGSCVESFTIENRMIMGCFVEPHTLILSDTKKVIRAVTSSQTGNTILDAVAGYDSAKEKIKETQVPEFSPYDADPHDEIEVCDADNATRYAARLACDGINVIVDLTAASDSSLQAASICSRALMENKTVMYVSGSSEQQNRFMRLAHMNGLEKSVLNVADGQHGRQIDSRLIEGVSYKPDGSAEKFASLADELVGLRGRLTGYLGDLHGINEQWGVSVYQIIENLARLSVAASHPATRVRLSEQTARNLAETSEIWTKKLVRLGELGEYSIKPSDTAWYHASIYTEKQAVDAYKRVTALLQDIFPAVRKHIQSVVETCGFPIPSNALEWEHQVFVLKNLRRALDLFRPEIFERDMPSMLEATLPKEERKSGSMSFRERRHLVKEAKNLLRPGAQIQDLHQALEVVSKQAQQWRTFVPHGGWPVLPDRLDEIIEYAEKLQSDLTALSTILANTPEGGKLESVEFQKLEDRLKAMYEDHRALDSLPERSCLEREIQSAGLNELVEDLNRRKVAVEAVADELQLSWWTTLFEATVHSSPLLSEQDGTALTAVSDRFAHVDSEHIRSISAMVDNELTRRLSQTVYDRAQEANRLHVLLNSRPSVSAGRLLNDYPNLVRAAKPLFVGSPAAYAAATPSACIADIAIIDGAAHMHPLELLSVISRARTVAVLAHKESVTCEAIKVLFDYAVTVKCSGTPVCADPRLIGFLREHGYGKIDVVPAAAARRGKLNFAHIEGEGVPDIETGIAYTNMSEVEKIVSMIVSKPVSRGRIEKDYLLTVVCLSDVHRLRIGAELKSRSSKDPGLRQFLRHVRIININEVGGLRSDDVIISTGFCAVHGQFRQQYGFLDMPSGDGMLLDALAMAQCSVTVVSAFESADMDDSRIARRPGACLLKELLEWGSSLGGEVIEPSGQGNSDILLADLAERIRARGLSAEINYGYENGEHAIPLAVGLPGSDLSLVILTDDSQFMSVPSARLRHRRRMENLQATGWSVIYVWSVSAFVNPDLEVDRIVSHLAQLYSEAK